MLPKLRLHPDTLSHEVLAHQTPSVGLGHEVAALARVVEVEALEATLFYCGRILEGLAAAAVERLGLSAATLVFDNLVVLEELGLLRGPVALFAHALRRQGNDARHLKRQITLADAEVSTSLVTRWLGWYFCEFAFGPRFPSLTRSDSSQLLISPHSFSDFLVSAEHGAELTIGHPGLWLSSTPGCVAIRQLIDVDRLGPATKLLAEARQRFPDDLLLRQLEGLLLSRSGHLEEALAVLEPLARQRFDEEETGGILAGVHKRLWRDGGQRASLEQARKLYAKGWSRSGQKNTYLGINAATLALMAGDSSVATDTAAQLTRLLQTRRADIERRWAERAPPYDAWERATLAEALLIQGMIPEAREQYRLVRESMSAGGWRSTRRQAELLLDKLGLRANGDFLSQMEPAQLSLRVAVTGHRVLPEPERVERHIEECLRELLGPRSGSALTLASALAAGADQLAARVALDRLHGGLHAYLPLEVGEYAKDFDGPSGTALRVLVARASSVQTGPAELSPRDAAYEWAGRAVVDCSEWLIACWDGLPARGRGGTAEIVAYARERGVPVIHINTNPGGGVTWSARPGSSTA